MTDERPNVQAALDYYYGLLEPEKAKRVAAWLDRPECADVRREAERIRGLLAAAARSEFPNVRFAPPTPRARVAGPWAGWLVAAAVLFAAGLPAAWQTIAMSRQRRAVDEALQVFQAKSRKLDEARAQQTAVREQLRSRESAAQLKLMDSFGQLQDGLAKIRNDLEAKQLSLVISGPANVLPGAPNVFQIQTVDGRNSPVPATVSAIVRDQKQQVVFERTPVASAGRVELNLPADLPLTPYRELFLEVAAKRADGPKSELREQIPLALPAFLTHLTTDKPMYQPGETVYFRSLTLERFTLRPSDEELQLQYLVLDPQGVETPIVGGAARLTQDGAVLNGPDGKPLRGVGSGDWTIPPAASGGEYTLVVREQNARFPESRRRFLVNRYQPARIDKVLEWSRKTYGPGDVVVANLRASRAEGGPLASATVRATATLDGVEIPVDPAPATDSAGRVAVRLTLPKSIERGSASLNVVFSDGGNTESLIKPIPITLNKLDVEFFPEGGDLIAGAPNRVYFQSRTTLGKPADLRGRIVDSTGREVARAETLTDDSEPGINQGFGRFQFTPEVGQTYRLDIDSPVGIEGEHRLPAVMPDGVVLTALDDVTADPAPLRVSVRSAGACRALLVGAYARGRLLDHQRISVPANETAEVVLKPVGGIGGVTRITVFEERSGDGTQRQLKPVAERLVYRRPSHELRLTAKPDRAQYSPGDTARLHIAAQDENGRAAPAIVYLGVVNNSVVTMADEKTARSLPTHFLLTSEVRHPEELEHADILLGTHPKAATALDLLLGTQGWRRFAEQSPADPVAKVGAEAGQMLVAGNDARNAGRMLTSYELESERLTAAIRPAMEAAQKELEEATKAANGADPAVDRAAESASVEANVAAAEYSRQYSELADMKAAWRRQLDWLLPGVCAAALLAIFAAWFTGALGERRWLAPAIALLVLACGAATLIAIRQPREVREMAASAPTDVALKEAPAAGRGGAQFGMPKGAEVLERLEPKLGMPPGSGMPMPPGRAVPPPVDAAPQPAALDAKAGAPIPAPEGVKPGDPGQHVDQARKLAEKGRDAAKADDARPLARGKVGRPAGELKDVAGKAPVTPPPMPAGEPAGVMRVAPAAMPPGPGGGGRFRGGLGGGGAAAGAAGVDFLQPLAVARTPAPLVVRQYAYRHSESANPDRSDFAETLYWHPALVIPSQGQTVAFDLSDSVTSYRVLTAGHTLDGRLGSLSTQIEARKPLSIEPKLPVEISSGDTIHLPVTIANDSAAERTAAVRAESRGLSLATGKAESSLTLGPQQRLRQLYQFRPDIKDGTAELRFSATADGASDSIVAPLKIVPDGFPVVGSISDALERVARHEVVLPPTWLPGTLKCQVSVFPSTMAELQRGLEGLLQEPGGCFEQTSTTNYPNTLVLDYLHESRQADPEIAKRARDLLERGYTKLAAFEVPAAGRREGFEWFGQSPPHEALTAYGLMQFRDMARVSAVDPALIRRTRDFLMARRDGKGGFQRNPLALDTFGRAPNEITNAYIVWALTESGPEDDVARELDTLQEQAKRAKDPYFLALVANALLNRGRTDDAMAHLKTLATSVSKDGFIDGAKITITGSTGRMAQIETTALAVLGWLKANRPGDFTAATRAAVAWIGKQRSGSGAFGSTQSTILALKALIAYTRANKQTAEAGELTLFVAEKPVGRIPFDAGTTGELTIPVPDVETTLRAGTNDVRVEISGRNSYPYTLSWSYRTVQPPSGEGCPVQLTARLAKSELSEGDATQLHVALKNTSGRGHGMTVAVLGLPAGFKLPDDLKQLKDLAALRPDGKPGVIGSFEVRGRELVLYWRDLAPDAAIDLAIDLRAHVPGEYAGPASRAYLYYNPDAKHWTAPLTAKIRPRE